MKNLNPKSVWENFYLLTQIPRPSGKRKEIADFLVNYGKSLGLQTEQDEIGNVLISKPASAGMENRPGVILQAHMDMVPQKTDESTHNFETDPIETWIDGEWLKAKGTTLGADDGIGVAAIMAVMEDKSLVHGPVEALITADEETGMFGANGLPEGELNGDILINLDSEHWGKFVIGSAGGIHGVAIGIDLLAVFLGNGSTAHHNLHTVTNALLLGQLYHLGHYVHGGGQQSGAADDLAVLLLSGLNEGLGGDVGAQVNNFQALAFQHHLDQVLADVVQVALDGADADAAGGLHALSSQQGLEQSGALAHSAGSNQNFGNEHFVVLELFADDVHAVQQTLFQNGLSGNALVDSLLNQGLDDLSLTCLKLQGDFLHIHIVVLRNGIIVYIIS